MRKELSFRLTSKRQLDASIHAALRLASRHPGAVGAYGRLLRHVQRRTDMLGMTARPGDRRTPLNAGLLSLALHHAGWLQPPESWEPPLGSFCVQFASLAAHLLAQYPVPAFMVSVWFDLPVGEVLQGHRWYKHLGRGGSVRTAGFPLRVGRGWAGNPCGSARWPPARSGPCTPGAGRSPRGAGTNRAPARSPGGRRRRGPRRSTPGRPAARRRRCGTPTRSRPRPRPAPAAGIERLVGLREGVDLVLDQERHLAAPGVREQ
jgi:hypothetical protein